MFSVNIYTWLPNAKRPVLAVTCGVLPGSIVVPWHTVLRQIFVRISKIGVTYCRAVRPAPHSVHSPVTQPQFFTAEKVTKFYVCNRTKYVHACFIDAMKLQSTVLQSTEYCFDYTNFIRIGLSKASRAVLYSMCSPGGCLSAPDMRPILSTCMAGEWTTRPLFVPRYTNRQLRSVNKFIDARSRRTKLEWNTFPRC